MLLQTIEECGELIKAISKYNRVRGLGQPTEVTLEEAYENLLCELVDVQICLDHVRYLMNIGVETFESRRLDAVIKVMNRRLHDEWNKRLESERNDMGTC